MCGLEKEGAGGAQGWGYGPVDRDLLGAVLPGLRARDGPLVRTWLWCCPGRQDCCEMPIKTFDPNLDKSLFPVSS